MDCKIEVFANSEFGELEVLKDGDKFYFPATKCAEKLGYSNPHDALKRHCKTDGVVFHEGVSFTTNQHGTVSKQTNETKYISEGNLYRLIVRSKLPSAVRFELWVFDEVLPSIRKHGLYATPQVTNQIIDNPDFGISILTELKKERAEKVSLFQKLRRLEPKVKYYDMILENPNSVPITMIAKDYGMSAIAINKILYEHGIQFKMRGTWELYQKYAQKGYTHTNVFVAPNGDQKMHTCWTQRGRLFLYELLKKDGIIPSIEKEAYYED